MYGFFYIFSEIALHIQEIYRNNTEDKSAQEGVASIVTKGQVRVSTDKATQNKGEIAAGYGWR